MRTQARLLACDTEWFSREMLLLVRLRFLGMGENEAFFLGGSYMSTRQVTLEGQRGRALKVRPR